jgi:hypothetical protein
VTVTPNDTDSIDPFKALLVIANITDTTDNFDTALFQWVNGSGDWNNITLHNQSAREARFVTVNGTFSLPSYETSITYRIWVNDTAGDDNSSANGTLSSLYDCTWNSTSDLGATAGWSQNKWIGNITLNNTGDSNYTSGSNCTLYYRLSYSLSEGRVYFDGEYVKPSTIYTVAAGGVTNVSVNATFLGEVNQESATINTSEVYGRSATPYRTTSAVIVSNQAGPYLYGSVSSSPSSVNLTGQNFSLTGYIRNLMGAADVNESNTAYNATFYWSTPSGVTNASGSASLAFFPHLTNNSYNYITTNMTFSDLASFTPGTRTIALYAAGYNSTNKTITDAFGSHLINATANVSFECYNETDSVCVDACGNSLDPDCPIATSGTTTVTAGGGGAAGRADANPFASFIREESAFELVRGTDNSFAVEFENPYPAALRDITIRLTGLLAEYIDVSPAYYTSLAGKAVLPITATIRAPKYFSEGTYTLTLEITGTVTTNQTRSSFTARKSIRLTILEFSREEAGGELNESARLVGQMKALNFTSAGMEKLLSEMQAAYESNSFSSLNAKYIRLKQMFDDANDASRQLDDMRAKLAQAATDGVRTPETTSLLNLAEAAFVRGDFALALSRIKDAQLSYALEVKGEFNVLAYIRNHPVRSGGIAFAVIFGSIGTSFAVRRSLLKKKLSILGDEESLLIGLMKVVQNQCFKQGKMSMDEYQNTMSQYEGRLNKVIQDRIDAESRLANLFKLRKGRQKALREEAAKLREMMKDTQRMYFKEAKIETRIYENMIRGYAAKLSDVEEKLATIEAQGEMRKAGFKWRPGK